MLLDNRLVVKCQHFAQGKQSLVADSKGTSPFQILTLKSDRTGNYPGKSRIQLGLSNIELRHSDRKTPFTVDVCFPSLGYLCERRHLEKTDGCCQTTSSSIRGPYVCDSCTLSSHCCSSFEHCVSCCLRPDYVSSSRSATSFEWPCTVSLSARALAELHSFSRSENETAPVTSVNAVRSVPIAVSNAQQQCLSGE